MTTKRERNFIRIKPRTRNPDFMRKGGAHESRKRVEMQVARDQRDALDEWAEDYAGMHSVFED